MCPHEEKLTAWLLGDLPPAERDEMARHLDGCEPCRAACDELARVLGPLRSGLEKDRVWRESTRPAATAAKKRPPINFWLRPHEGLKRAALFLFSAGALFALVSTAYRHSLRDNPSAADITHIVFRKAEPPAPTLTPLPALAAAPTAERFDDDAPRPDVVAMTGKPVCPPPIPPQEPSMPSLPRLAAAPSASAATLKSRSAATPNRLSPARSEAKDMAFKRERAKQEEIPSAHTSRGLETKPVLLAGTSLASTNTPPTNAVPAAAEAPSRKRQ